MKKCFLIILLLVSASCGSMPVTKIYNLSLPEQEITNNKSWNSSLAIMINAPRYLEQPYIIHRVSEYQIDILKYSKWDSSPSDIVKTEFKKAFDALFKEVRTSGHLPEGFYLLDIKLKKFERNEIKGSSVGELEFDIKILSPEGNEIYNDTISKSVALDGNDNEGLAKALSSALSDAIGEVKGSVSKKLND